MTKVQFGDIFDEASAFVLNINIGFEYRKRAQPEYYL